MLRVGLLAIAATITAGASELNYSNLDYDGRTFSYQFAVEVQAPIGAVHQIATDYAAYERLNESIVQSEILEGPGEGAIKRRVWVNYCLLLFCFDLYFVEQVEETGYGLIESNIVPGEGNFRRGHMTWRLEAIGPSTTRMTVTAEQEPDFWIPPVLGPYMFKRALKKEARATGVNLEYEAQRVVIQ